MLYLVKKMKSVQCCGFSLSFWDGGSVVKERLAFAINEVAISFQAKLLEGPTGSWVCKLRSSSSDRLEDPISTMWALRTSSHIRQACSMLISPCVVIWGLLLSTPFKLVWLLWRGSLLGQLKKAVLYSRKIKKICRGWIHFLWGQLLPSKANI